MDLGGPGFIRRIYLYLVGVMLGTIFVYFTLLRNREFPAFWPAGIVKESIIKSTVTWEEPTLCAKGIVGVNEDVFKDLITNGKVRFNRSEPRRKPYPIYHIETTDKYAGKLILHIELANSTSTVKSLVYADESKSFNCE